MGVWPLLLASAVAAAPAQPAGRYVAVTETEYELELVLAPSGRAELKNHVWEADRSSPDQRSSLKGRWVRYHDTVQVSFAAGQSASFRLEPCLPHAEFGGKGCSPGLKLIQTTVPATWGLQRFGLWRSDLLRSGA